MRSLALSMTLTFAIPAMASPLESAREHYRAGSKAYDVGEYATAATEFALAYKAQGDPSLLFNLAQAHRLAGHNVEALHAYQSYLTKLPKAPNRAEVQRRITELSALPVQETDEDRAKQLYGTGEAHRVAGELRVALDDLGRSQALRPRAETALALGRTHDALDHRDEAVRWYHTYLTLDPRATDAAVVQARIDTLSAPTQPVVATVVAPAPARAPNKRRWVLPVAIVGGIVVVGLGVGLGLGFGLTEASPNAASTVHFK